MNANKESLIISLYGGPGTGKSTSMAHVFAELKWLGINCEMAPEFAKEKVWEKSLNILGNQVYVFGKQLHTLVRLVGQVDVIITDSPLLLSLIYGKSEVQEFKDFVLAINGKYRMLHVFLERKKAYNPSGRLQTEEEARVIDQEILTLLKDNQIPFLTMPAGRASVPDIVNLILEKIGSSERL